MAKRYISIALVVIWMAIIFCFSAQPGNVSSNQSREGSKVILQATENITGNHVSGTLEQRAINKINNYARKIAHNFLFFILTIFFIFVLKQFGFKNLKIFTYSFLGSFMYALSDEFHQKFVVGRSSQFSDVISDTIGIIIALICYFIIFLIINYLKKRNISISE